MVECIKLKKEQGQQLKEFLILNKWLDNNVRIGKTQNYLFFPINESSNTDKILHSFPNVSIENRNLEKIDKKSGDLKQLLKRIIPAKYIDKVHRSFDLVGDIAVLDIPKELVMFEKSIAWTLFRSRSNIEVVAKRRTKTSGKYRIRKIKLLIGNRTETIHRESGVRLKVDLNKSYFSPRLGTERERIGKLVKPHESILVMFAGVGPYPLVILKKQPAVDTIHGIEINPDAIEFFKENLKLNKKLAMAGKKSVIDKVIIPLKGDVKKIIPKLNKKFDRIIMVLPAKAEAYLDIALKAAKKGTIIHMYKFVNEKEIDKAGSKAEKKGLKVMNIEKCGQYAPGIYRVCLDMKVK